jgi:signal transduction histidine kinase
MDEKKKEIVTFVEEYFKIYFTERNYSKLMPLLSPEITVIGTGINEFGKNAKDTLLLYKKDFSEVTNHIEYSNLDINVTVSTSHFSIVTGDFSIKGVADGISFVIDSVRYSFIIRKENGTWKILHLHISTPNDKQEDDELYPLQKLIKQNELLNQKVEERTTKLVEVNTRLKKSNQTKEKLFSIIAHDIKSPFSNLLGFIDILKNNYEEYDIDQHKKFINIISDSSHRIYSLTDNLLLWSNLQQDRIDCNLKPINLKNIVQESAELFNEILGTKNINFLNNIDNSIIVLSDEFMLSTIFRNLISNAVKFSHPNGSITISIDDSNPNPEDELTVCVEDTGVGMSKEKISKLFTSDINESTVGTNNEKGTGLGLSLSKEFINLLGNKLYVESKPNFGSKFYFNLKFV